MKQYKITKIIWADNIKNALKNETKADIIDIELNEQLEKPNSTMGFK